MKSSRSTSKKTKISMEGSGGDGYDKNLTLNGMEEGTEDQKIWRLLVRPIANTTSWVIIE